MYVWNSGVLWESFTKSSNSIPSTSLSHLFYRTYKNQLRKVMRPTCYIGHAVVFLLFILDTWRFPQSERQYFLTQKHRQALQAFEDAEGVGRLNLLSKMLRVFWLDSLYQSTEDIEATVVDDESNTTSDIPTHNQTSFLHNHNTSVEDLYHDNLSDHERDASDIQTSDDEEEDTESSSDDFKESSNEFRSQSESDSDTINSETSSNDDEEMADEASAHPSFDNAEIIPPLTHYAHALHPFQAWVMLFNMEGHNCCADPRKVLGGLASFQWVARMVGFERGLDQSNKEKLDNAHFLKLTLEDIASTWLSEGKQTVFSWARWLVHEATSHATRLVGLGTIHELSDDTFSVSGRIIHIPTFQTMIADLVKQTEIAFDDLLAHWGVTVDELRIPARFEDRVDGKVQGQWFGQLQSQTQATGDMVNATKRIIRAAMARTGSLAIFLLHL
jgi:hypothetical protein